MSLHAKWALIAALAATIPCLFAQPTISQPAGLIAVDAGTSPPVYAVAGGGIFSFVNAAEWPELHILPAGGRQPALTELAADPVNPGVLYAGTVAAEGPIWKTTDGGASWNKASQGLPDNATVDFLQIVRSSPTTLYAVLAGNLYKTTDGGGQWNLQSTLPPGITAFAISPANPTLMFAAKGTFLYRTDDEGANWNITGLINLGANTVIASLAGDPNNADVVFAAVAGTGAGIGIHRSANRGVGFSRLTTTSVYRLYPHPTDSAIIFATVSGMSCMDRSANGGATWSRVCLAGAAGEIHLAYVPADPAQIWAAGAAGVSQSLDAGVTWRSIGGIVKPTLAIPQPSYEFDLAAGEEGFAELPLRLVEEANWTVPVTVATSGEAWLSVTGVPANVSTAVTGIVHADTAGLAPGTYTAAIHITSTRANNAPLDLPVKLTVRAAPDSPAYVIDTYAGTGQTGTFGDNGPAVSAAFASLDSLAVDAAGGLFISDPQSNRVRRVGNDGTIRRYAGNGQAAFTGDGGSPLLAALRQPTGLAVDENGRLLIGDTGNSRIRQVEGDVISTVGTTGTLLPHGVAAGPDGSVYAALPAAHAVVRFLPGGETTVLAGTGIAGYRGDGVPANTARLSSPNDVAVGKDGSVYIADTENQRIRVVRPDGMIYTYAGNGVVGYQGDAADATKGALAHPAGIGLDSAGNLYIADTENHRVRVVTPDGSMRTLAGTGEAGFSGDAGAALSARLRMPLDVAVDAAGNVFVADSLNRRVRRLRIPPVTGPQVSEGGVVNVFDYTPRLAPGTLFSVFGTLFGDAESTAESTPLPTSLGGVTVTINGRLAPLLYVGPKQINAQVPFETELGGATLLVTANGALGKPVPIQIIPAAPAVLLAQNPDGSINSQANPAPSGSYVVYYLVGQGKLDNAIATGAAASADPLSRASAAVSATINGASAKVLFLGMTPGFVGLAQANIELPVVTAGQYTVIINVGGNPSNPVPLWVGPKN